MNYDTLLALVVSLVEQEVEALNLPEQGPRGLRGKPGEDGSSFNLEDHKEEIRKFVNDAVPKYLHLSPEDKAELIGPKGKAGKAGPKGERGDPGRDGKDFVFNEHAEDIYAQIANLIEAERENLRLKFSDLNAEEKSEIRGPKGEKGKPGKDGKDFVFEENKKEIESVILKNKETLKLKYSDLNAEEKSEIRGPKGEKGKPGKDGKDFVLEENKEEIENVILKNKQELKLKFIDLTTEEKNSLKLKFTDLDENDILSLKGPKGSRGQRGKQGFDGKRGPKGEVGKRGPMGPPGRPGVMGERGFKGEVGDSGVSAPIIVDVSIQKTSGDEFRFKFRFSDGSSITSNTFSVPAKEINNYVAGGGMRPSGGGKGLTEILLNGTTVKETSSINFQGDEWTIEEDGDQVNISLDPHSVETSDEGTVLTDSMTHLDFQGNLVSAFPQSPISDWPSMDVVDPISSYLGQNPDGVDVVIGLQNMTFVEKLSDLPESENGLINLKQNHTYFFTTKIDLNGSRLVDPGGVSLLGISCEYSGIKSTGLTGYLITGNNSLRVKDIELDNDRIFSLTSTLASEQKLNWSGLKFNNSSEVASIEGFREFYLTNSIFENSAGLIFSGDMGVIKVTDCIASGRPENPIIHGDATLSIDKKITISCSSFEVEAGETAINIDNSATIGVEDYELTRVDFSGVGTFLSGITAQSNKALFTRNEGIENSYASGQANMDENATATTITTQGTFVKVAGTTTAGTENLKFAHSNNKLESQAVIEKKYLITCHISYTGQAGDEYQFGIFDSMSGIVKQSSRVRSTPGSSGRVEDVAVMDIVRLSEGDYIELHVRNNTSTQNVTVTQMSLLATEL